MTLPTGQGDITNPNAWEDGQGKVPPKQFNAVPATVNFPLNGDGRYWWSGNDSTYKISNTLLLLHADGANNSTSFPDASPYNVQMSVSGAAVVSTANPKFGTGAFSRPGGTSAATDSIYTPVIAGGPLDILNNAGDFTIEMFFYLTSASGFSTLMELYGDRTSFGGTHNILIKAQGGATGSIVTNDTGSHISSLNSGSQNITLNAWHHMAIVRLNGSTQLYLDGTAVGGSTANWTAYPFTQPAYHTIGWSATISGTEQTFFADEIRISSIAQYTANFAPPTAPFTASVLPTTPIFYIGDPARLTGTMALTWQLTALSSDGGVVSIAYSTDNGNTFTNVALPGALQGLQSGKINVNLTGATGLVVYPTFVGPIVPNATLATVAIDVTRNIDEGPPWVSNDPLNPINYNCTCVDASGQPSATLAALRSRIMIRLGFSTQAANPPPGMAALVNDFLTSGQAYLYRTYNTLRTRRFFRWKIIPGQRFYSLMDNDEDVLCNFQIDPNKTIEWAGIQDTRNVWYPLIQGIPPQLYTMLSKPWRPARYDIRQCIELYPIPDQTYFLWMRANFGLLSFVNDSDTTTLDSELVFLHALANAKAHYGQPDATNIEAQANRYRGELIAATHLTAHYVPGTIAIPPAVRPTLVQFQDNSSG